VRRREVIAGLGVAAAWPLAARAQAPPVIGVLGSASAGQWADRLSGFREGLGETGYVEGKNVALEYRWAEGRNDRLLALAVELVRHPVAVIVVLGNTPSAIAANMGQRNGAQRGPIQAHKEQALNGEGSPAPFSTRAERRSS
jgi:putative tryptophan/tyrosine transport system substrate-binding protein